MRESPCFPSFSAFRKEGLFRYGPQRARRRRGEGMTFVTAIATAGNWMGDCRGSGGRSPPTCRARMREVHLREPPGTARACCAPSRRARFPPPSRPTPFNHPDSNNDWQTTAQWCEMSGTLVDFFLPGSRIPPPPRGAGGFPRTTGGWAIDRRTKPQPSASSSPRSEPRPPRWL